MAVRTGTIEEHKAYGANAHTVTWSGLLNGDSGSPVVFPGSTVKSIQFTGTFGSGGTIVFEGSNDGSTYFTLTDGDGNSISKTSSALETVYENTLYIRPRVTAGDGTTSLVAVLLVRRPA
jgi:hypothetical protein